MEEVMEISGMPEQQQDLPVDAILETPVLVAEEVSLPADINPAELVAKVIELANTKDVEETVPEIPTTIIPQQPYKPIQDMKVAIVVITIGQQRWQYERHFIPSIKAYAKKYNFEFIQLKEMLDTTLQPRPNDVYMKQTICMQKCLIASASWAQQYDVIIYMDADILVNVDTAPNILENYVFGKIGAVDERNIFGNASYNAHVWNTVGPHLPRTAQEYYAYHFPGKQPFSKQFNGGVLVFQPHVHADFFRNVYEKYMPQILAGKDIDGDQAVLNYEANAANLVHYMDERWNRLWSFCWILFYGFLNEQEHRDILRLCLKQIFDTHYFIHFAGGCGWSLL